MRNNKQLETNAQTYNKIKQQHINNNQQQTKNMQTTKTTKQTTSTTKALKQ